MNRPVSRGDQHGAALVVSLIMLALITVLVITALNLGSANFRAVSNSQFRDEAVAAAEFAVQEVLGSGFATNPQPDEILVDLDDDGRNDYVVNVARPQCIFANIAEEADQSSVGLPIEMSVASTWNTVWEIDATVAPAGNAAGAAVRIRSGVRVLLDQAQKEQVCQ